MTEVFDFVASQSAIEEAVATYEKAIEDAEAALHNAKAPRARVIEAAFCKGFEQYNALPERTCELIIDATSVSISCDITGLTGKLFLDNLILRDGDGNEPIGWFGGDEQARILRALEPLVTEELRAIECPYKFKDFSIPPNYYD